MTDAYVLTKPPADVLDLLTPQALKAPRNVLDLLRRLHQRSLDQETALKKDSAVTQYRTNQTISPEERKRFFDNLMRDKFIALVPDKCIYMYNLALATGALNVVEAGTSFGVSTIYLALAVGQNAKAAGKSSGEAKVIATENEPDKANQARQHWKDAGDSVMPWIELREGDLTQTLRSDLPEIDFVLFDIWTPMVMPTLKLIEPKLKRGAVLLADNTLSAPEGYKDFLNHLKAEGSPYTTQTLPFEDGLEMAVYLP